MNRKQIFMRIRGENLGELFVAPPFPLVTSERERDKRKRILN